MILQFKDVQPEKKDLINNRYEDILKQLQLHIEILYKYNTFKSNTVMSHENMFALSQYILGYGIAIYPLLTVDSGGFTIYGKIICRSKMAKRKIQSKLNMRYFDLSKRTGDEYEVFNKIKINWLNQFTLLFEGKKNTIYLGNYIVDLDNSNWFKYIPYLEVEFLIGKKLLTLEQIKWANIEKPQCLTCLRCKKCTTLLKCATHTICKHKSRALKRKALQSYEKLYQREKLIAKNKKN